MLDRGHEPGSCVVECRQELVELFLSDDGHGLGDLGHEFVGDFGGDARRVLRLQRVRAQLKMRGGIRGERIAGHANDSRVLDRTTGDAVPCDPVQVFAHVVENISHNTEFIGEAVHGVGQPHRQMRNVSVREPEFVWSAASP